MRRLILIASFLALTVLASTQWPKTPHELDPITLDFPPLKATIPNKNIFDPISGALYFFHKHRDNERGHFHTFLFDQKTQNYQHLIAIEIDKGGHPTQIFTTAPWVTGETIEVSIDKFIFHNDNPTSVYLQKLIQELKTPILAAQAQKHQTLSKPHLGRYNIVNFATVSTCTVCGNISTGSAASTE